ncbi:hypothetical protein RFI_17542 [Reticulomyxa filosa]|uniref:Uncharacterized protein n=1 Tax=Reticulomyxa filosa TaxID=46433 RepID=X6N1A1_RETFI|nr:hypothetical protein RFI_17542 [Reticulomyxa filosa]|eukprot:ETO19688.1 hypothetical protein RFI_17542 [Reticulomyxa filosa]
MSVSNADNPYYDLIRHNLVVFRNGENALDVLPPLMDDIPEARLNLVIHYLKNGDHVKAYQLMTQVHKPRSATEYILKAVVTVLMAQAQTQSQTHFGAHMLATNVQEKTGLGHAAKLFQLVGESESEINTISGRQCMASYHMLTHSYENVIIYLDSIKDFVSSTDGGLVLFLFQKKVNK